MAFGRLQASLQHRGVFKFLGVAAAHADQVVVIPMVIPRQLKAAAFGVVELLQAPHRAEQPQGAIHRGQGHPLFAEQQPLVDVFSAEVAALAEALEQIQYALALGGEALTAVVEAAAQAPHRGDLGVGWGGRGSQGRPPSGI